MTPDYYRIIGTIGVILFAFISYIYALECYKADKDGDRWRDKYFKTRKELEEWKAYATTLYIENVKLSNLHETAKDSTFPEHTPTV